MRKFLCFLWLMNSISANAQIKVKSPNDFIEVSIHSGDQLSYSISYKKKPLVFPSVISLHLKDKKQLPENGKVKRVSHKFVNNSIISPVPEKRKIIPDIYNELTLHFAQPINIIFRVYNDGVAFRFKTAYYDSLVIQNETAQFTFSPASLVYFPEVEKRQDADSFHTSFEEAYKIKPIDSLTATTLCFSPVLIAPMLSPKVLITESDLEDYPGMFLRGKGSNLLSGSFAPYPIKEEITTGEFPQAIVTERADYIAKTKGTRYFPWRIIAIEEEDKRLPSNDIVYRLASPSRVDNTSWIRPGKGTDEWIIGINLFDVPFKAGINTATYKYYIDFAKRFGFDRIMLDAGWSDYKDLFKINPNLNMDELVTYAKEKGIQLSLWTLAMTLDRQLDSALKQFQKWGISFIMTDFMDRDDQKMVNFYHRIAQACAKHKIMVMYHGAFKPAGFNRTYPNAITREAVLGSEFNIWSYEADPANNVLLPFIRMVSGPMDYEPGLLQNATRETFRPIERNVMSLGTRCHQLAMFVVYDSPIQLFSGNPSQGYKEPRFMDLLGKIPTTWDETIIPEAKLGEYIITARQKGKDWYLGGMTNWTKRSLEIPLSFLDEGTYKAIICADGINADRYAADYLIIEKTVRKSDTLSINMAPGGGYMAFIQKINQ
jgi:alpha-glucosidase